MREGIQVPLGTRHQLVRELDRIALSQNGHYSAILKDGVGTTVDMQDFSDFQAALRWFGARDTTYAEIVFRRY